MRSRSTLRRWWTGSPRSQLCRSRGSTPATLPTPAVAPLGGSPFKGPASFWTSNLSDKSPSPATYNVETDASGNIAVVGSNVLTAAVVGDVACVYHAADVY